MSEPAKFNTLIGYFNGEISNNGRRLVDGKGKYNNVIKTDSYESGYNMQSRTWFSSIQTEDATNISTTDETNVNRGTAWKLGFSGDDAPTDPGETYGVYNMFHNTTQTFTTDLANGFTFSFYAKRKNDFSHYGIILGDWGRGGNNWFGVANSKTKFHYNMGGKVGTLGFPSGTSNDNWIHYLISFDGTYLKFFINGTMIGNGVSTSFSAFNFSDWFVIGHQGGYPQHRFRGIMASFHIFNAAITPDEAKPIHDYTATLAGNEIDTKAPVFSSAVVAEATPTKIEITFDENIAEAQHIRAGNFSVSVAGEEIPIYSVAVSNGKVNVTLASRVYANEEVMVSYTKATLMLFNISDINENYVANFTSKLVSNNTTETSDTIAPIFFNAIVDENYPKKIEITFNESIAYKQSVGTAIFSVHIGWKQATISSVAISNGKVCIYLRRRIYKSQVVKVSYARTTGWLSNFINISDSAFNFVNSFYLYPVYNNTTLTEQAEKEAKALNIGISNTIINVFKTGTFTVNNGKSTLDNTRKDKLLELMQGASDATDKRKKRRAALKLLFSQESTLKKMVVPKTDLELPSGFTKTNALVVKAGETVNISDLESDEGFYSVLDDGETVNIATENTTLTFTRDDNELENREEYKISATSWTDIVINSDNVTGTFSDENKNGVLLIDDSVTIDGRIFIIGSVADGGTGGSGGDPYVFPIKSNTPVKLPNKPAVYRMFEQGDNYVNVEVGRATEQHKLRMFNYARNLTPVTHNIVMDGYFYQKAFISAEGHKLTLDYSTKKVEMDENSIKFFKIKQSKKLFDCGEFNEDAKCWNVGWTTKENKKIQVQFMFFPNPHIENGINILPTTLKNSTGLIVDNYKPKLMEIPSLTTEKFGKLHRRFNKSKNKFQKMSIKGKNEKWHINQT